jgi:hypothetical protein
MDSSSGNSSRSRLAICTGLHEFAHRRSRQPRRRCCRRRVHGPAKRLVWENVLTSEVRGPARFRISTSISSRRLSRRSSGELFLLLARQLRVALPDSSTSAWAIQFRRHDDSDIRRSFANSATGLDFPRASSTARRRNSSGWGAGTKASFPVAAAWRVAGVNGSRKLTPCRHPWVLGVIATPDLSRGCDDDVSTRVEEAWCPAADGEA